MDNKSWRENLVRLMEKRGLKQIELAKISEVDQSTISSYINGSRHFTQTTLRKLLKALQADYHDLFCPVNPEVLKKVLFENKRIKDAPDFDPKDHRKYPPEISFLIQNR